MIKSIIILLLLLKLNMFNGWLLGLWIADTVISIIINAVGITLKIVE